MSAPLELVAETGADASDAVRRAADPRRVEPDGRTRLRRVWLDTADRRLTRAGVTLTRDVGGGTGSLSVHVSGVPELTVPSPRSPRWAADLPDRMRDIADTIEMRALLPLAEADVDETVLAVLDERDKTVARVALQRVQVAGAVVTTRLAVRPLRGYERQARRIAQRLSADGSLAPASDTVLDTLLTLSGTRELRGHGAPGDGLTRDQASGEAFVLLFRHLLDAVEVNVDGAVAGTDTEFLHDLRVAVRRTRTALKIGHGVVADETRSSYGDRFRWLGDVTTPARDLDVHLLEFPAMVASLPPEFADSLAPVHAYLERNTRSVRRTLARDLRSATFRRLVRDWSRQLEAGFAGPEAERPLGPVADQRVATAWRKVLKRGSAVDERSAPEALHDLRKRCKELRYALEFFGGLHDPDEVKGLIKELKVLQDNLGAFQDNEVQRQTVERWATELGAEGAPAATLVAIGRLAAGFDDRQAAARARFHDTFARFARRRNRERLAVMLGTS